MRIQTIFTVRNEDLPEHELLQSDKGCKGERGYFLYLPAIYVIIEFLCSRHNQFPILRPLYLFFILYIHLMSLGILQYEAVQLNAD